MIGVIVVVSTTILMAMTAALSTERQSIIVLRLYFFAGELGLIQQ
jgi:hypothetical protein